MSNSKKNFQICFIAFDVIFIIIFSLLFHLSRPITSSLVVYVPQGSIGEIITYLDAKNFNLSPKLDSLLLRLIGKPQKGWVNIANTNLSRGDFLYKLSHSKAALQNITLIPGETTEIFLEQVATSFTLSKEKLLQYFYENAPLKDGIFVPETYHIPRGISEKHLIHYLLGYANEYYRNMALKIFGEYDAKKWHRYLVVASIIQKEAFDASEMSLVSSVIYNRLKKNMPLQMDGTLNYGKYSHTKVTPQRIKEDNSKYNTYKNIGLPPQPVGSVQNAAIFAAIFPKTSDYLYFVRSKSGGHLFAKSYEEHKKNINKLK
ncbi:MAG: endolytic transglycosylase MltG [Sulfurospirillum sp.]|nr:endolytic transglycosylase MltG [Sulfurospirillum sp.]